MSDPTMPGGPGAQQEPSEEELRAYLGQMRQTPVAQLVADVFSALANGAQVKIGRRDGRLLLDLAAGLVDQAGPHLEDDITREMGQVVAQLRMAQVEAEQQLTQARAAGQPVDEPNDLDAAAAPPPPPQPSSDPSGEGPQRSQPPQPPQPGGSKASRLWVPGRP